MIPLTNDIIELSVYADYLEDQGKYTEALYLREELQGNPDDDSWHWCYHSPVVGSCYNFVGGEISLTGNVGNGDIDYHTGNVVGGGKYCNINIVGT